MENEQQIDFMAQEDSAPTIEFNDVSGVSRTDNGISDKIKQAKFVGVEMSDSELDYMFRNGNDERVNQIVGAARAKRDTEARTALVQDLAANPTQESVDIITGLSMAPQIDFNNFALDKEYASKFATSVAAESFTLEDVEETDPELANVSIDVMEEFTAKSMIIRDIADQYRKKWEDKGLIAKAGSWAIGSFVPFLEWGFTSDAVEDAPTVSWLPGNNVDEQIEYIWSLPADQIASTLKEAVDDVATLSDYSALVFINKFMTYSTSDKFWDNAFGVVDVASVVPVAKVAKLAKSAAKGTLSAGPDVVKVASAMGDVGKAAVEKTVRKDIISNGVSKAEDLDDLLPSIYRVDDIFAGVKNESNAAMRKLKDAANTRAGIMQRAMETGHNVDILTESERYLLATEEFNNLKKTHSHIQDSAFNMEIIKAEDAVDNVDRIKVKFGMTNGEMFPSEKAAKTFAERYLQFKDATVEQLGDRWFIQVDKPIRISGNIDNIQLAKDSVTPRKGYISDFLQGEGNKLSAEAVADRRTVSDLSEYVKKLVGMVGDPITQLNKNGLKEVEKVMDFNRRLVDSKTGKRKWLNVNDFISEFTRINDKVPSEQQIDAFVSYRQLYDLEYAMQDMALMQHKMRAGVENFEIKGLKDSFEGVQVKDIPFGTDEYFKVIVLDEDGKVLKTAFNNSSATKSAEIKKLINEGNYTIVQSFSGVASTSEDLAGTFIMSRSVKRSPVKFGQSVNYNPGGHIIAESPFYIKQATIKSTGNGKRMYKGDNTVFNVYSEKQGMRIVALLEEARGLLKQDKKAFQKFMRDNFPELNPSDYKKLDWSVPFTVTRSGSRTIDSANYTKGLQYDVDLTKNSFNMSAQLNGRFLGERKDKVIDAIFSEKDSVMKIEEADLLRPVEALQVGLSHAVDLRVMNDYIFKQADRFKREFGDYLDLSTYDMARNPMAVLSDPKFKTNTPDDIKRAALKVSDATNHLLGVPTKTSEIIQSYKNKVLDWSIDQGKNSKANKIVSEHLLHTVNDPAVTFRSIAFHTKMGFYNIKQMFLQSQIWTNIAALGGTDNALKSTAAYVYSYGLALNPRVKNLDDAAQRMKTFGWKPEHFKESHEALMESGWDIVGGSVAYRDLYEGPKLVGSKFGKILDQGTAFYRKGEHYGRVVAWHTSYQNWRKANPTAKLDRAAISSIRMKASDYTANMTRDMNSVWQRGVMAVPTQFWGYQARIFEQLISPSSRLSAKERARLFSGISLMYGIPVGLSSGVMVWPIQEEVKKYLMEEGLDQTVDENMFLEFMRDGLQSTLIELATGMDLDTTPYGPAGNPFFKELVKDEKNWYEMFGGASAGIIADLVGGSVPLVKGMYHSMNLDSSDDVFGVTVYDLLDTVDVVSTANNAIKLWKALNTGKWISRNETVLGDVNAMEAFTSAITSLELEDITDTYLKLEASKEVKNHISSSVKEVAKEYQRARRALESGDEDAFEYHMKRAKAIGVTGGLEFKDMKEAHRRGFSMNTLEESAEKRFNDYVVKHYERKQEVGK